MPYKLPVMPATTHRIVVNVSRVFVMLVLFGVAALTFVPGGAAQTGTDSPAANSRTTSSSVTAKANSGMTSDVWFQIQFDGKPVGYEQISTTVLADDHVDRMRRTCLTLERAGQNLSVRAMLETTETTDGRLLDWKLHRTAGDEKPVDRSGVWRSADAGYETSERVQGTRREDRINAIQLASSPVISGWLPTAARSSTNARFRRSVLFPETSAILEVSVHVAGGQSIRDRQGQLTEATRIDFWPDLEPALVTSLFVNSSGEVLRSEQPLLGSVLTLIRTDPATAVGSADLEQLDTELTGLIPLQRPITSLSQRETVRLKITPGRGEQILLPNSATQQVEQLDSGEVVVTLKRPQIDVEAEGLLPVTPLVNFPSEFQSRSRWLTKEAPTVQRIILQAGQTRGPVHTCEQLTRHLNQHMKRIRFSTALIPADEVARHLRGDCTEHAILLATLLRASGIPSRVAVGLHYVEKANALTAHMWAEAFVNGQWLPFDSTIGPANFGVTHIKVLDSPLTDDVTSGTVLFLPLLNLISSARVEVLPDGSKGP